jgi:hypothetical protein
MSLSPVQVTDLGPTEDSQTEQVSYYMSSCNHFLGHCTGAELIVKNLGHAHTANAYKAARLRRGGHKNIREKFITGIIYDYYVARIALSCSNTSGGYSMTQRRP